MSDQPRDNAPFFQRCFYWVGWVLCWSILKFFWRTTYVGTGNIPRTGACLLVANHQSHLDPPLVGTAIRGRPMNAIARLGLFKHPAFGWVLRQVFCIPIREESGDMAAIKEALRRLEMGRAVVIFAEGSRSPDGALRPFKRGAALLFKRSKCPVIPVAVEGCFDAMPRKKSLPNFFGYRVMCAIGEPISHDELMSEGVDGAMHRLEIGRASCRERG